MQTSTSGELKQFMKTSIVGRLFCMTISNVNVITRVKFLATIILDYLNRLIYCISIFCQINEFPMKTEYTRSLLFLVKCFLI